MIVLTFEQHLIELVAALESKREGAAGRAAESVQAIRDLYNAEHEQVSSLQAERDRLVAALTALANVADHATTVLRYPQPRMCEMHATALGRAVREARSLLPAAQRPAGEGTTEAPPTGD